MLQDRSVVLLVRCPCTLYDNTPLPAGDYCDLVAHRCTVNQKLTTLLRCPCLVFARLWRRTESKQLVIDGPIICPGHSRPVPDVAFRFGAFGAPHSCLTHASSHVVDDETYFMMSSCLDGKPMIRDGVTGDWYGLLMWSFRSHRCGVVWCTRIGTFEGHKGAVWCARLDSTASFAATASADFSM